MFPREEGFGETWFPIVVLPRSANRHNKCEELPNEEIPIVERGRSAELV